MPPMPFRFATPRRALPALALLAVAAIAVAGCGGGGDATADSGSSSSSSTHPVRTVYGPVEVPNEPKRIVALDFPEATALADLGVKPVGVPFYIPSLPAYETFFKGLPKVTDSSAEPQLEDIAALEPDLIVGDVNELEGKKGIYEKLSQIAPTALFEWQTAAGAWEVDAMGTAEAIGKTAPMEKLRGAYEAHAAKIGKKYADVLDTHTVDLLNGEPGVWYLYGPTSSHAKVLIAAGAKLGAGTSVGNEGFAEYSTEKYPLLKDSGILVVGEESAGSGAKEVTSNPLFANLPAAKAGDVMETPYFFPSSYAIAEALLGDFEAFLGTVKG
jgi:iron complex transport system substrate-binding protein